MEPVRTTDARVIGTDLVGFATSHEPTDRSGARLGAADIDHLADLDLTDAPFAGGALGLDAIVRA